MSGNRSHCRPTAAAPALAALLAASFPWYASPGTTVEGRLSEWKVELSTRQVPAGQVTFKLENTGSVPHQFEVEGQGIEEETGLIQPGASATLTLDLKPGHYEIYCPVGNGSHKHLGMETELEVGQGGAMMDAKDRMMQNKMMPKHDSMMAPHGAGAGESMKGGSMMDDGTGRGGRMADHTIRVTGAGPVIQILPGSFPFPDSAGPILRAFGEEQESLESQSQNGPYSDNVVPAKGTFTFSAWDFGPTKDSVMGTAEVTTRDGVRWKVVMDRVQTRDVPHHPKFGGVIMGLYYHGATQVHTPLVPTINSAVALWAFAHLYRNGTLVTDNAWVHVMLLSRTRHPGDWKLACWDCSSNPIEELQLQVTSAPGDVKIPAPGGFLFVNWEKSVAKTEG